MILLDANILIYAHVESFTQHVAVKDWLDQQINGSTRVAMPLASLLMFLRIVTNAHIFERPEQISEARKQVHTVLGNSKMAGRVISAVETRSAAKQSTQLRRLLIQALRAVFADYNYKLS